MQDVHEQIQIWLGTQALRIQLFLGVKIREQNLAGAIGDDQRPVKGI
jgi:hypothetical protein